MRSSPRLGRLPAATLLLAVLGAALPGSVRAHDPGTAGPGAGDASARGIEAGSFTLVDHTGSRVSDEDFRGEYLLVYFGYTNCPDVCPLGLFHASNAIRALGEAGRQVRPLFITVDPRRDTVEKLAGYVGAFHPRMVGLTGSPGRIRQVADAYGVDYIVARTGGEYLVHHSAFTYLVAPDGHLLRRFPHEATDEDIAAGLREVLAAGRSESAPTGS